MVMIISEEQKRVSGSFPLAVNGAITRLRTGEEFDPTASALAALDAAGIAYEETPYNEVTGEPTGRIKLVFTSHVPVIINGQVYTIAPNLWFLPAAPVLEALQRTSYRLKYEYEAPGEELGPNLIVNGDGSSAVGWEIDQGEVGFGSAIADGKFSINDVEETGICGFSQQGLEIEAGATYRVTFTVESLGGATPSLSVALGGHSGAPANTVGPYSSDIVAGEFTYFAIGGQAGCIAVFDDIEVREVL